MTKGMAHLAAVLTLAFALGCSPGTAGENDASVRSSSAQSSSGTTAIENVSVLTMMSEEVLRDQTVVVHDGGIAAVGPAGDVTIPDGAMRIDGRGRVLMPGLADMHVHFGYGQTPGLLPPFAALYVVNGVTTTLNMSGEPGLLDFRGRVERGEVLGPTIFTTSPSVTDTTLTRESAQALGERYRDAGYDLIKLHNHRLPLEAIRGLASVPGGLPLVGHVARPMPLDTFLDYAVMIAHAEELLYGPLGFRVSGTAPVEESLRLERIPGLVETVRSHGTWVTTTLSAYRTIIDNAEDVDALLARPAAKYFPPAAYMAWNWAPEQNRYAKNAEIPGRLARSKASFEFQQAVVLALYEAGVPLLAGTDATIPGAVPGFSLANDVVELVEAGVSPYDALASATVNANRFIETFVPDAKPFGTVTVGAQADLLLLDGNPLQNVEVVRHPRGVMVRGRWLDRSSLDSLLAALEYHPDPPIEERIRSAIDAGASDEELLEIHQDFVEDPNAVFASSTEGSLNVLGYGLLGEGRAEAALQVFRLNVHAHPDYANGYDSLGEALAAEGRIDEAIRSYERALELDPNGPIGANARIQLRRLRSER